jgi:hypothetical protein
MLQISKANAFIAFFCLYNLFVCAACSGSSSASIFGFGPPDGYLAIRSGHVAFIQFTESNNRLDGHMQGVDQTNDIPPQTKSYNYAFTGIQNGTSLTVSFPVLWSSVSFTGTFIGDTITLDMPQSDGHIVNETFNAASIQQYNQAVDALQKQVSQQDHQYYDDQATAEAIQVTATAIQNEKDAVSDANYHLKNALSALKSDSNELALFSTSSTLSGYARDWQQMQNDYKKEQNDAANGCGENNYNQNTVQYDDNTVGYDYNSITYDDNSLSYDKNTYDSELSAVQNDLQAVKSDWTALQSATKANTTGMPISAYTQSDIDAAIKNAQDVENTASNTWQSAKASAGTYDSEASDLKKKADAIPSSMSCS